MKRQLLALCAGGVLLLDALPAQAFDFNLGIFKRRQAAANAAKTDPARKTKELLTIVATNPDVDARRSAIDDLRAYDPKTNPDIITVLAKSIASDPSASVRQAAVNTLGKFNTVYQTAATALEDAASNDPDKAVRAAALASLNNYGKLGYKTTVTSTSNFASAEPPLARAKLVAKKPDPLPETRTSLKPVVLPEIPTPLSEVPQAVEQPKPSVPTVAPPPSSPLFDVPQQMPPSPTTAEAQPVKDSALPELPKSSGLVPSTLPLPEIPQPAKKGGLFNRRGN